MDGSTMSAEPAAPFDSFILTGCKDSMETYQLIVNKVPLTKATYTSTLSDVAPPCREKPDRSKTAYVYGLTEWGTTPLVVMGEVSANRLKWDNYGVSHSLVIPETTDRILFGMRIHTALQYSFSFEAYSGKTVDPYPPANLALIPSGGGASSMPGMDHGVGPSGGALGVSLIRFSRAYPVVPLPPSGLVFAGTWDYGLSFSCDHDYAKRLIDEGRGVVAESGKTVVETTVFHRIKMSKPGAGMNGDYKEVLIPFTKQCAPFPDEWWEGGYGNDDDLGHLAGAIPLFAYSLLLTICALPTMSKFLLKISKAPFPFAVRMFSHLVSPYPYGSKHALLDSLVLSLGGFIPAAIHYNTLMNISYNTHELYHFLAHAFTFCMGFLSLCTRIFSPSTKDYSLPISMAAVAVLFTFHGQGSAFSVDLHVVYAGTVLLFSLLRLSSILDPSFGHFAGFAGMWSALLLVVASDGGVRYQIHLSFDVPATTFVAGCAAAGVAAASGAFVKAVFWACGDKTEYKAVRSKDEEENEDATDVETADEGEEGTAGAIEMGERRLLLKV